MLQLNISLVARVPVRLSMLLGRSMAKVPKVPTKGNFVLYITEEDKGSEQRSNHARGKGVCLGFER